MSKLMDDTPQPGSLSEARLRHTLQSGRTWDRVGLAHIVSIVIRTAVSPVLFALHEPRLDRIGLDVVDDRTQLGMVANVACGRDARGPSDTGVRPAKGGGMSIMAL